MLDHHSPINGVISLQILCVCVCVCVCVRACGFLNEKQLLLENQRGTENEGDCVQFGSKVSTVQFIETLSSDSS